MKVQVPTAFEALAKIIKNVLGEPTPITLETRFEDDLGADSLDLTEVLIDAEHEFRILIPDDEAPKMKTVGDVMAWLRANADLSGYAADA